jgi:hypothetical protein
MSVCTGPHVKMLGLGVKKMDAGLVELPPLRSICGILLMRKNRREKGGE